MWLARCARPVASCAIVALSTGCGTVLGIEEWDVEPGAGGASSAQTTSSGSEGGAAPGSTSSSTGGGAGDGGGWEGGGGTSTATGEGGAGGGCGVPDTSENCGACGRSCWGGECVDGTTCGPTLLLARQARTNLLAVTGDHVVLVDGNGELRRVRKSNPEPQPDDTSLGGIPGTVTSLAAGTFDGQHAVVHARAGRITRRLLDQADPTPLVMLDDEAFNPEGLTPSGGYVYWSEYYSSDSRGVRRSGWTEAGASQHHCYGNYVRDLAMIGSTAFYVDSYVQSPTRKLLTCSGWGHSDLSASGHLPLEVETDPAAGHVFYTTIANNQVDPAVPAAIWRKPAAGGPAELFFTPEVADAVSGLVRGGGYLYWRTNGGELVALPTAGGELERLATGPFTAMTADDEGVYWSGSGQTWALRRD